VKKESGLPHQALYWSRMRQFFDALWRRPEKNMENFTFPLAFFQKRDTIEDMEA